MRLRSADWTLPCLPCLPKYLTELAEEKPGTAGYGLSRVGVGLANRKIGVIPRKSMVTKGERSRESVRCLNVEMDLLDISEI